MVISSGTPVQNVEVSPIFQRELGTPPKFSLKKPKESWDQIVRKAAALRSKTSMTFNIHEIYERVIEAYPYFKMENPEVVHQNIRKVLRSSDFFKSTGHTNEWTVTDTFKVDDHLKPDSSGLSPFKIPTAFSFSPIREPHITLRPLIPNNRQLLPSLDSFGPPKLAPLLPFPSSPTLSNNGRQALGEVKDKKSRVHPGFSPIRSLSGIHDVFTTDINGQHDSDTEDEDWKSIGPDGLFTKKYPLVSPSESTYFKQINLNLETGHIPLPPTPITPEPHRFVKPVSTLPSVMSKAVAQVDDEDTDDENWAQMDLTPKRKSINSSLESHTPMKKALCDITQVGEQLSNDKKIALEALALLCSPSRDTIPKDTERHRDARQTPIYL